MRLAVLFHRLGPYHHARLQAAGKLGDVTAVEFSPIDRTYQWVVVPGAENFRRVTLIEDRAIEDVPVAHVVKRINEVLDDVMPDVVAIPGWGSIGALCALGWCMKRRVPALVMSETTGVDARRHALVEGIKGRILRLFSGALVGGTPHRDYVSALGVSPDDIRLGYDAVDNDYFWKASQSARANAAEYRRNLGLPENYFLASNRFVPQKNIQGLIRAYADYCRSVGDAAWNLVLLGEGVERQRIDLLISALGIESKVVTPGFRQYEELPAYYGLARAFIHASTIEPWGLVVNEAMASGLPVLVSRQCGCAADLVHEGDNGFTFDAEDSVQLTKLMVAVGSGHYDLAGMGAKSRNIVDAWSVDHFAEQLWDLAKMAVQKGPTPRASYLDRFLVRALLFQ